jgi:preprotein translocase subunit SecB
MAEQESKSTGNGAAPEGTEPQAAALAQYVKDLSVESPSAPQVFQWPDQPQLEVNFQLNVERASDELHEVQLKTEVKAQSSNGVHFLIDLTYAGLFAIRNFPEEALGPFLLVEAPRLLFPFSRQIIADAVQDLGFPPVLLDPIDFAAAYLAQAQQQAQAGAVGGQGEGGEGAMADAEPASDEPGQG